MVHATPLVESLAAASPGVRIVVAGGRFAQEIYGGNPHVERVLAQPDPVQQFRDALRTAPPFNGEPYTTLLTTGNERTKVTLWAALIGPSRRVGFAVKPSLLHDAFTWDPEGSQISNNLRLLQALDLPAVHTEPRIHVLAEQAAAAEAMLRAKGVHPKRRRIALVTQTSPTQRKGWRAERWELLASSLVDRFDADLIFVGTDKEVPAIEALRGCIRKATHSVAGETTIAQLAAVLTRCDFGITLDTGPLHVGRAVRLPLVVIAPAWSPVHEWLPLDNPEYTILKNADFPLPAPHDYIIDEVSVDDVLHAAFALAQRPSAHRDTRAN